MRVSNVLLVAEAKTLPLARRWWQTQTEAEVQCIIVTDGDETSLQEVKEWGGNVPVVARAEQAEGLADSRHAYLILETPITAMGFVAGGYRAGLGKHTKTFSELHRLGVRKISIYAGGWEGEFALEQTIDSYQGCHKGERCFVIGNGPSLAQTDMSLLREEITLGSNRGFLGFERWGFPFRYWSCGDMLQMEEYASDYETGLPDSTVKFIPFEYALFSKHRNQCFINQEFEATNPPLFSKDPSVFHMGNSITYTLMQMGAMMGCTQIVLLGIDHHYPVSVATPATAGARGERLRKNLKRALGDSVWWDMAAAAQAARRHRSVGKRAPTEKKHRELWTFQNSNAATHFDPRYTQGKKFLAPALDVIERAFVSAKAWGEANGVEILNATPGTRLDVLPKVKLEDVIASRRR